MGLFAGLTVLAHPLTEHYELGVSPLALGVAAFGLVFGVGQMLWLRRSTEPAAPPPPDQAGPASAPRDPAEPPLVLLVGARIIGVALLALVIAAGLLGREDQLFNIAPALAVGG